MGEFKKFFEQATEKEPYHYQRRLAEENLPDLLDVPTGLGKTAAAILEIRKAQTKIHKKSCVRLKF